MIEILKSAVEQRSEQGNVLDSICETKPGKGEPDEVAEGVY
jgi:hypothetical protein